MATKQSRQSREQTICMLEKSTKLTREEVIYLMDRFDDLCKHDDHKLRRLEFRDELNRQFHITDDILMDRVFRAFDRKSCGVLLQDDYVVGIAKFISGTLEDYIQLCFNVYDLNSDGFISREEMFHLLKSSLVKAPSEEDPDEMVKDLVELVMKKLDLDHDGKVSLPDFRSAVVKDKLMLEALGKCLPDDRCKVIFQEMMRVFGGNPNSPTSSLNISQQKGLKRTSHTASAKAVKG